MAFEEITKKQFNFDFLPEKLRSRKLWGAIVVTLIILLNSWVFSGRALTDVEIGAIAAIWGVYNYAEGKVDAARAADGR